MEKVTDKDMRDKSKVFIKAAAKRMPRGVTKVSLLLFVAQKGKIDTADLQKYLKKNLGIKNKKNLREHLSFLLENGLLSETGYKRGLATAFFIEPNFHTFHAVFNYTRSFKDPIKIKTIMKSQYFKSYVSSEDFKQKFFVHLIKEIGLGMFEYVKSDAGYEELIDQNKDTLNKEKLPKPKDKEYEKLEKEYEDLINEIRNASVSKAHYTKLEDLDKALALYDYENKKGLTVMVSSLLAMLKSTDVDKLYSFACSFGDLSEAFLQKVPNLIMPDDEIEEMLAMIKASPSAADFILNFREPSATGQSKALGLMSILTRFLLWTINDDPEKANQIGHIMKEDIDFIEKMRKAYPIIKDFSRVENKSPLYTVISSNFIFDFVNRELIVNQEDEEILGKVLNDILVPKISKSFVIK